MKGLNQAQYPLQPGDFFAPREDGKGLVFYSDTIKNTQIDSLNQYMGKVSPQFLEDIEHNYLFAISKEKVPLHLEVKRLPQQKQKLLQHSPPLG